MAVYVDDMAANFGRMKMCHMVADSEQELEQMARKLGLNLSWWQYKGHRKSHFDISLSKRKLAVQNGAVEITVHELGLMMQTRDDPNQPYGTPDEGRMAYKEKRKLIDAKKSEAK